MCGEAGENAPPARLHVGAELPIVVAASGDDRLRLRTQVRGGISHGDEIRALVIAFNRLQARLSRLRRARMALLGGISHDGRTFATRLRLRVENLPDSQSRDRAIEAIAAMIRLLDDALLAARAGVLELALEVVDVAALLRREVEDRRALGGAVTLSVEATPCALADPLALRRVVGNLVDNACTYGHAARLVLAAEADEAVLHIDDERPGLLLGLADLLFEPFVRGESSRSRRTGGAGLGLAVARALAEAMGARLSAAPGPGGGARFTVRLPLFTP